MIQAKNIANSFNIGDILVVAKSNYTTTPTFFRIVSKSAGNGMFLRTIGTKLSESGGLGWMPCPEVEYHDSYCRAFRKIPRFGKEEVEFVPTWCGDAYKWNGLPC